MLVVGADGHPFELWTTLRTPPRASAPAVLLARRGSAGGPELALTPQLREAARKLVAAARFGRPGRIWSAAAAGG